MSCGEFDFGGRSRVLLLVSHGGQVHWITSNEILEAREAFDPETFETGYLDKCWTYAGLVSQWFSRHGVPSPWSAGKRPLLLIPRGHPREAANHEKDAAVIDLAIKIQAREKISDRAAVKTAIGRARIVDKSKADWRQRTNAVVDRLRTKLRKRRRLRRSNKTKSS
jgi:hypothetical protein